MLPKLFAAFSLVACVASFARADDTPPQWLREATRVAYTDLPNINDQGDWPIKLLDDCAKAKVQVFFSRAHSGEGWEGLGWKSEFGAMDPRLKGVDGTRRITELCHQHGIRYIAYYWAQREPAALATEHPDWRCITSAGKPSAYFCVNTGYGDLMRNRVAELVAKVGVDGIFFDMFHARDNECYCPACTAKFRKLSGHEPPKKEEFANPVWQQWVDFKYRTIEESMLACRRAIKAANPQAVLVVNSWNAWVYRNGHNTRNSIRVAQCVDGLLEETGWYDSVDPSFFAFPALHNFMSWHLGGLCKDTVALMWSSPSYLRMGPVAETEATIRAMVMLTNGSVPAQSVPGRDTMAKYMAKVAARSPYMVGARLYPWCGLLVSEKTELWYGRDDSKNRYVKGVYGAYQAMLEQHLPVSLVTDRELELGKLEPFRVIFAPNCAALSDKELDTLRGFVRGGGGLVLTYETGWYDEHAQARSKFGFDDILPLKRTGEFDHRKPRFGWLPGVQRDAVLSIPANHPWRKDTALQAAFCRPGCTQPTDFVGNDLVMPCQMLLLEQAGAKQPIRLRTVVSDPKTGMRERHDAPGVLEANYGKGKIVYLPYDLTWAYFRYGCDYLARITELSLRAAAAEPPPVEVRAPRIVQAMTHQQGQRLVVHLLNDISSLGRSQNVVGESTYERREIIPIADLEVTFRDPAWKRFTLVPGNVPLKAEKTADGWRIAVPKLQLHAMVVAEK